MESDQLWPFFNDKHRCLSNISFMTWREIKHGNKAQWTLESIAKEKETVEEN